ncbi:MAG: ATP synthase F1 subunit epsilon [Planctomycetota bacterium]|nr:MAG: ATP synthase F1 subunit epsilon [Planctomycetota bacterium]
MAQIQLVVVTPEETALEAAVDFVAVPLEDGELGVLPGRAPMIGRLGYGEMRLRFGSQVDRYFVDGGFVQIADNVVSVLTSRAVPAAKIDREAASNQLSEALALKPNSDELFESRDKLESQARALLRVARG